MLVMMKAIGRSIDVLITATVRTQVQWPHPNYHHVQQHAHAPQSVFQALMEHAATFGFDVQPLDISGRPRLFDVDDSLVQQLNLRIRPEVLNS